MKPLKGFTLPTGIRREKAELPVENRSIVIVNETAITQQPSYGLDGWCVGCLPARGGAMVANASGIC